MPKKVKLLNEIIGLFQNDGSIVENIEDCDYAQILLKGDHAINSNASMLISRESIKSVLRYDWYLGKSMYPVTYCRTIHGSHPTLHRFLIFDVPKGYVVDHINHDRLDNRLDNLRICTAKENSYNTKKREPRISKSDKVDNIDKSNKSNKSSEFKGVKKTAKGYQVTISKDGVQYKMGGIKDEIEAAKLYDMIAEELFGEFAGKNFFSS